jgi:WD40 repeat protein
MTDLHERFRELDRLDAPDVWAAVERRGPARPIDPGPSPLRRVGIILLAFVIAAAGIAFAAQAFRSDHRRPVQVAPTVSNGKIAFAQLSDSRWQIHTMNPDGTSAATLAAVPGDAFHSAWSMSEHRVLFDMQSAGRFQIYAVNDDGTGSTQLTDGPGWNYLPAWSPDATRIAFVSTRDGNDEIYVMDADGTNQNRLTNSPDEELSPSWAPDGSRIAFQSDRDGNNEIYVMNSDGTDVTRLTHDPGAFDGDPAWSPDGGRILFASDRNGPGVYAMNVDGSGVAQLTHDASIGPLDPVWSPDGTSIAYTTYVEGTKELGIFVFDLSARSLEALPGAVGDVCCPSWQPVSTAPAVTARVTDAIDVGPAGSLAHGEGSVWVAVSNNDGSEGGHILRIDPDTAETIADIPVDAVPTWEVGGGGLSVTDGSVLIAGAMDGNGTLSSPGGGSDALLLRIDATTNQVVDRIPLGGLFGADVAIDDHGAWAMIFGTGNQMEVHRIDPATDQVVATIPLQSAYGHFIFAADGHIVAATNATHESTVEGMILNVIDPATNEVVASTPLGYGWPAAGSSGIYVAMAHSIVRIDPATGEVAQTYSGVASTGDAIAVGEGGVWFFSSEDRSSLHRLNTDIGEVDVSVDLPGKPIAMTTSPGAVWTLDVNGMLMKVSMN